MVRTATGDRAHAVTTETSMKLRSHERVATAEHRLLFFLGLLGTTGALSFLAVLIALHVLRPDMSPVGSYVSDYANGIYGLLFRVALIVHGFGNVATAAGLTSLFRASHSGQWGVFLFGAAAAGTILGGVFSIDPAGVPSTIAGSIHRIVASLSFPLEAGALLFLFRPLRTLPGWRSLSLITSTAAPAGLAALLWLLVAVLTGSMPGLAERAVFAVFLGWEILAAINLMWHGSNVTVANNA